MSKFKHQFNQKLKDSHHISGRETPCITGSDRSQTVMFPPFVDDYVSCDNQVRFIDAYMEELDLSEMGFTYSIPELTGRPSYKFSDLLKLFIYGYLVRVMRNRYEQ